MKPNAYIDSILKTLPELPGVYRYYNSDGEIIYVGKAKNLKRRVNSYFNREHDSYKTTLLVKNIVDIKYSVVSSEQEAFLLENNFIKQHQPHYNILLKDGKSYPSICITKEPYPRVFKTRNRDKRLGEFFGPYSYSNTVDLVLELIHQLYPIRTCHLALTDESIRAGKHKVCLKYHLKNCCGICENLCTKATYDSYIEAARKIIKGDADVIARQMMDQMRQLAEEMRFEEAQQIKEQYLLIEKFRSKTVISGLSVRDVDVFGYDEQDKTVYISMLRIHNGSIIQGQTIEYKRQMDETREEMLAYGIAELRVQLGATTSDILVPFMPEWTGEDLRFSSPSSGDRKKLLDLAMQNVRQYKSDRLKQADKLNPDQRVVRLLGELQKALKLNELPMWIDSFDNSNIQGTDAVAGCVVFKKAKPSKADYKRFKIKTVTGADDYASMREIVYRRYSHLIEDNAGLPNLIIADGGISSVKVVVNSTRDTDAWHIEVLCEVLGSGEGAVSSDDYQCVHPMSCESLVGLLSSFGCPELLAPRTLEEGAAPLDRVRHALRGEVNHLVLYKSLESSADSLDSPSLVYRRPGHSPDAGIHTWSITS